MREEGVRESEPEILMEITMKNLLASGELDLRDFLDRVVCSALWVGRC